MTTKQCENCEKFFEKKSCDSRTYWETKRFCSISCSKKGKPSWNRGIPRTWKSSGDFQKGQIPWNKGKHDYAKKLGFGKWMKGRAGILSNGWKGENIRYGSLHQWVYRELGRPDECSHCGLHTNNPYRMHWANKSNEYKREIDDWIRLCAKCHKKYDKGRKQHKYKR